MQYNRHGLGSIWLYVFLALMIGNCGIYAIAWQQVIKKFSLSTAYANKSVYLLWSQIWAVVIFHENLSVRNIIGILVVLTGVLEDSITEDPFQDYALYKCPAHQIHTEVLFSVRKYYQSRQSPWIPF